MDDPRLGYYFLLHKGDETVLYSEAGFAWPDSLDIDHDRDGFIHFQFPYVNVGDIHRRPSWVDGAVFYQIFLDRFCNGDPSLDPEDKTPWGELPTVPSQYGGDLRGLIEKLDYLQQLGANALYLCPIFEARTNHKYDTVDYTRIDPGTSVMKTPCGNWCKRPTNTASALCSTGCSTTVGCISARSRMC